MARTSSGSDSGRAVRPRNRRDLITAAASELFHRQGYAQVGMSDIAKEVGVRPSALYRHVDGKQQLLARAVLGELRPFLDLLDGVHAGNADRVVVRLAAMALEHRRLGVLWQREARNVTGQAREELKEALRRVASGLGDLTRAHHDGLSAEDARFRGWCLFSTVTSPSYHRLDLPRADFEVLLAEMVRAVIERPVIAAPSTVNEAGAVPGNVARHRVARRGLLLSAATRLFAERGYAAVTIEDIGAAVGITGPSVYSHFASKQDLLASVIARGEAWLEVELERTLAGAHDAVDALGALMRLYAGFVSDESGFIDILVGEVDHLPAAERHRARQIQREYVTEWVALLREARPELDDSAAGILVHGALTVANDMARTGALRDIDAVVGVGRSLLFDVSARLWSDGPVSSGATS
ncbi:TetR/AcrR family transcriptional regulator [Halopolyspora algeriensis]|uniref:TetR/AcrR family transcriptional regulator n=1 Tax=Halopolyspora algeriensis TaxID=1500506 RepID=UPI001FECB800|nr:TetR/AcrR family transcriptional regulator [Halopolyspora algeriensis]